MLICSYKYIIIWPQTVNNLKSYYNPQINGTDNIIDYKI